MTAEVALLNKHAVALAADSAVTITGPQANKIYNAANKVFALSKCHPIGIMVYGNAEYMGVPWETIIKIYREQLGEQSFLRLEAAYDDFMSFLGSNDVMFGEEPQKQHVIEVASLTFLAVREEIRRRVDAVTKSDKPLGDKDVNEILTDVIDEELGQVSGAKLIASMDEAHEGVVRERYGGLIDEVMAEVLEKLPLSETNRRVLRDTVVFWLIRDKFPRGTSGIVIAGFGSAEHFPVLRSATVQARIAGKLKFRQDKAIDIGAPGSAAVVPFAQIDAVRLFVEGIDPKHALFATKLVAEKFDNLLEDILGSLEMDDNDSKEARDKWSQLAKGHWRDFSERARQARVDTYVDPLVEVIASLPKDELAAVAEALVNITSLRRKISMDAETVGGPIDVAVISKGDGLIWIKRKHYFSPELNPHFVENYFRCL